MTHKLQAINFSIAGIIASFFYFQNAAFANTYSNPISGTKLEDKLDFKIGESVFQKFWVPSPSSTTASDGLGSYITLDLATIATLITGEVTLLKQE
ncbi:hypothetical protein [Marinomonas sp. GJ51-6]|uniref:hypothetical protein n=1 Tax=Marinomonas sp. GJ51-6 TaxID=2992802 RepID=UPI002934910A|nr:hypothetical protein [Marinomonas sp. GJ51-6]WOD09395.1 hypothetical protein ONZ50_18490 [Marinomonas sp. GJ51-6]